MIIDGHSHVTLPIEKHIAAMDQAKVEKTILFSTTLHPETAKNAKEVRESFAYLSDLLAGKKGSLMEARKRSIQELMQALQRYPDRFLGFGSVPVDLDMEATMRYVDECIHKNSLIGMGEFAVGSGQMYLLENAFKASMEFGGLPIWIHAFFPLTMSDIKEIAQLAKQYPETGVVLGHLGGIHWLDTMDLADAIPNLYLDTSAFYSTLVLGTVINDIPHKCIFGVDSPYGDIELCKESILRVAKSPSVANAVLGDNIRKVLDL